MDKPTSRKWVEPCPHCGQDMPRNPTTEELALDGIVNAINAQIDHNEYQGYWPGTVIIARKALKHLESLGLVVVMKDQP